MRLSSGPEGISIYKSLFAAFVGGIIYEHPSTLEDLPQAKAREEAAAEPAGTRPPPPPPPVPVSIHQKAKNG